MSIILFSILTILTLIGIGAAYATKERSMVVSATTITLVWGFALYLILY
jgi:hypothetical protein